MAARKKKVNVLPFADKLVLNQWILSLLGVDPLMEHKENDRPVRPFHVLAKTLRDCSEGRGEDDLHYFYQQLKTHWQPKAALNPAALLQYEQNIVEHTDWLNADRQRPIVWKYYQWLSLLFAEIYLHQYFSDRDGLLDRLNEYVERFNAHWESKGFVTGINQYVEEDLNKLCLQNATGSGKTLLMHVNYRQFAQHAEEHGQHDLVTRTLLITPNEGLSRQHELEMLESGIEVDRLVMDQNDMFGSQHGHLTRIDYTEITKLGERDSEKTIATRNLGDQNLILVDEGHRGMGKADEEGWYYQRSRLTEKGFAFEYSATFKEAVKAANNSRIEESYAKQVLFDYSYRFFYEDGYGKDYRIFNIPKSQADHEFLYLTACLLGFYQQLRLYKERKDQFAPYNLEKPLWVFVGGSVSKAVSTRTQKGKAVEVVDETASDIVQVLSFLARFLAEPEWAVRSISELLGGGGKDTGLLDKGGNDIFAGAFLFLMNRLKAGESAKDIHADILATLFNNPAGGELQILRLKGDSGELLLRAGSDQHFGLINVGDALGLARHIEEERDKGRCPQITVYDSDFQAAQFDTVRESSSPINLLMGAKKFVEGWDCWRVSTLGLMRVGRSEGSQIIQLFGRGVRLKGFDWSLKRSSAATPLKQPEYIQYIETLNVFGVQADFMEKFREFLKEEGLPGNDSKHAFQIPMNVTYDFGQNLKVVRPKRKDGAGREYNFNRDGAMPLFGSVPEWLTKNRVEVDWYPKIQAIVADDIAQSQRASAQSNETWFTDEHIAFLDVRQIYFELEQYKARENLYSLIIVPESIRGLLRQHDWYLLKVPSYLMALDSYSNVRVWNQIALELLKRYSKKFFMFAADEFIRPRLEVRELDAVDKNLPGPDEHYQLTVDSSEQQLITDIERLQDEIGKSLKAKSRNRLIEAGQLKACILSNHLFQPLLFSEKGAPISIAPVALNDSEKDFVVGLMGWLDANEKTLQDQGTSLYLLRNKSRGSGVGFFEAGNFYPDFILWLVNGDHQKIVFVEPHGISHEGPEHPKIKFHETIKDVENRLGDPNLVLESCIVTPTRYAVVKDRGLTIQEWEDRHVLFMHESGEDYINTLFRKVCATAV
jgi:type III restriction/modification enzyme restriction subunit